METDGTATSEGPTEPLQILLSDLMTDISIVRRQEDEDRLKFIVISNPNLTDFRTKLITWIAGGCRGMCDLVQIQISVPTICSDGVVRTLIEYVQYLTGTSLADHIASFQTILPDFEVAYRSSSFDLVFCVTRIKA